MAAALDTESYQRTSEPPEQVTPRSCYNCHRRKIRCDKRQPCARCARAGKPCTYPPIGQRIQRPRKTTMAWVANRLSTLEKLLPVAPSSSDSFSSAPEAGGVPLSESQSRAPAGGPTTATPRETEQFFGEEILVQKGSQSQYFNEPLHSRMIEQQKDIQSLLSTPPSNRQETAQLPIYNPMGILSAAVPSQPSHSFFPSKQTALKLWNAYLERIEGCSGIKLLHIPTDEARLCATMASPADAQPEDLALCYAVFFAAMAVVHPREAQALVQPYEDAAAVQSRCKIGLEQALTEAEVLDKPTLPLLCALALYLSALQLHNRGKGIWVLNGLAIRIAQGMGLHRDGERLGLSPFQSELRRRVWWHIISRDGRAAEDYGLQRFCNMRTDASLPLHVDDADLHPDMTELPRPRVGTYTAMTLPLVNFAIARAMRRLSSVAAAATPASPPQESARVQIIQEAKQRVDELLAGCNPVIPRHRLALLASRLAIRKADLVSRQQWLALAHHHHDHDHHNHNHNDNVENDSNSKGAFATGENLTEALDVLDLTLQMWNDEMLKPYSWLWKTNPEYHVVMYLLWHLCVRPPEREPNVRRAWSMVDRWFAENREIIGEEGEEGSGGNKAAILIALRRKAALMRDASAGRETGTGSEWRGQRDDVNQGGDADPEQSANLPFVVPNNQEQPPPVWGDDSRGSLRRMSMGVGVDHEAWTTDLDQVPDWGAFIQAFQFDGQNLPGMAW